MWHLNGLWLSFQYECIAPEILNCHFNISDAVLSYVSAEMSPYWRSGAWVKFYAGLMAISQKFTLIKGVNFKISLGSYNRIGLYSKVNILESQGNFEVHTPY